MLAWGQGRVVTALGELQGGHRLPSQGRSPAGAPGAGVPRPQEGDG